MIIEYESMQAMCQYVARFREFLPVQTRSVIASVTNLLQLSHPSFKTAVTIVQKSHHAATWRQGRGDNAHANAVSRRNLAAQTAQGKY